MTKKTFHWGIIGLGKIAHKFAQGIAVLENASVYAVASRTPKKAKDFARQYNVEFYYNSYEDLMYCDGIDAIYIATPHVFHFENTMLCLRHKIAVLCEKPFAINNRQVQKMVATAKANNTFLMEALWTRFLPSIEKVLELIANDVIGEVHTIKADFGFKAKFDPQNRVFNNALGGGALLDIGIYPLFLALLIFGKPNNIQASAKTGTTYVDETCAMILDFPKNKIAILHATIIADTPTEAFIYGSKG
ncbi:MAG TPA: Gfo/Idh/MocA family oxidoreductase, partial [Phaeodactylibacter sp.]|nr:Gfo/Idh/MocA family oxidoreductase [Phaeodactylibacter sp.]